MSIDLVEAHGLADVLEALAEERSDNETAIITAAIILAARLVARIARTDAQAADMAVGIAGMAGALVAIERAKNALLVGV